MCENTYGTSNGNHRKDRDPKIKQQNKTKQNKTKQKQNKTMGLET